MPSICIFMPSELDFFLSIEYNRIGFSLSFLWMVLPRLFRPAGGLGERGFLCFVAAQGTPTGFIGFNSCRSSLPPHPAAAGGPVFRKSPPGSVSKPPAIAPRHPPQKQGSGFSPRQCDRPQCRSFGTVPVPGGTGFAFRVNIQSRFPLPLCYKVSWGRNT